MIKVISLQNEKLAVPPVEKKLKLLLMEEIRRSLVDMVNIQFFTGFHTSQVVQDFFHQQWQWKMGIVKMCFLLRMVDFPLLL